MQKSRRRPGDEVRGAAALDLLSISFPDHALPVLSATGYLWEENVCVWHPNVKHCDALHDQVPKSSPRRQISISYPLNHWDTMLTGAAEWQTILLNVQLIPNTVSL